MENHAAALVRGVQRAMEAVGASEGGIAIKAKRAQAVEAVQAACRGTAIRIHLLGDYYPAGDEYDLVYTVTGRLIPPRGIPLNVGVPGQQRRDLRQCGRRSRRPARHAQDPDNRRRGEGSGDLAGADRNPLP